VETADQPIDVLDMNVIPRANEEFDANGNKSHLDGIIDVERQIPGASVGFEVLD
jgi:hypothetical protein